MTFEEYLLEHPIRINKDADFEEHPEGLVISLLSRKVLEADYDEINNNFITIDTQKLSLYKHSRLDYYIIGFFIPEDNNRFGIITNISFRKAPESKSNTKILPFVKPIAIQTIHTTTEWRGHGISSKLYHYIVNDLGYTIISDAVQFKGAVALWKRFPEVKGCSVYIYNITEDKIISKYTSNTPDSHVWSDDTSKMSIRLVFTKSI